MDARNLHVTRSAITSALIGYLMKLKVKISLFFMAIWSLAAWSAPAELGHLLVDSHPKQWQLIFEVSKPVSISQFQLDHPNRVVIDLHNVILRKPYPNFLLFGTPISEIRAAEKPGHILRLVLDVQRPVHASGYLASPTASHGFQVVINLNTGAKHAPPIQKPLTTWQQPQVAMTSQTDRPYRNQNVIVVIDPGHGGKDPGASGLQHTHEKNVVLAISRDLQAQINSYPGFRAYLTRTGDYFITLRGRLNIARQYKADMFIAVHADAYRNTDAHGVSVFALSERGVSSEAARWLARRENASELMGGVDLGDKSNVLKSILINLSQTATIRTSLQIGQAILYGVKPFAHLHHNHVEQAAFVVLKSPDIPSLLVETGFLSNAHEEQMLNSSRYQMNIAQALARGITQYFTNYPPRGTALSLRRMDNHG